jgi:hypothetical protein
MDLSGTAAWSLNLRNTSQRLLHGLADRLKRDACRFQEAGADAPGLFENGRQEMFDIDSLMAPAHRQAGGSLQRFLQLDCHAIHVHRVSRSFGPGRMLLPVV